MRRLFALASASLTFCIAVHATDAADSLRSWISVDDVNLHNLSTGKFTPSANTSMNLAQEMSCQWIRTFREDAQSDAR